MKIQIVNRLKYFPLPGALLLLTLAATLSGCKTISSSSADSFAKSAAAVKTQADSALNSAATLTRNESITFAASQPTLREDSFVETPSLDVISQWDDALSAMETYAQNLSTLLSPAGVDNFDVAATNLFNQLNRTAAALNAAPTTQESESFTLLATAFTQVAGAIIQAKEQATAVKVAAATDQSISNICYLLAGQIGADRVSAPCLRKTLNESVWVPDEARLTTAFLSATQADKLSLSQQYADLLAKRDAEDQILASLRRSLLLLSDAHHALAQGQPASVQSVLNVIAGEVQHTQDLLNQFSSSTRK